MRQKFPGVARAKSIRWKTKNQVWDSYTKRWVKFCSNTNCYIQAEIEFNKQQKQAFDAGKLQRGILNAIK